MIVASANLTENGYRQNLEVFTVWDFHRDGRFPASLFGSAADFATEVLTHCRARNPGQFPALERSAAFLTTARRRVSTWLPAETPLPRLRSALVPVTPKTESVFAQLTGLWPGTSPPHTLYVLSPFYDQAPVNTPALSAWSLLCKRGYAAVLHSVTTEPINAAGKLMVHAPETLATSLPENRRGAQIHFEQIKDLAGRPLHAKSLWLQNDDHFLHCLGSSNFTSAGLGLGSERNRNWELNVAAWARRDDPDEYRPRVAAWPLREDDFIDPASVYWEPRPALEDESDPNATLLPAWCGSAVYFLREQGQAMLELNFIGDLPPDWTIWVEGEDKPILDATAWRSAASPKCMEVSWSCSRPPTELIVRQADQKGEARWPVEVREFKDLPPPQELRDLTLEQLLAILTSSLPLYRCLQKLLRQNSDEPAPAEPAITLDPLRRFSRESHLLERTRRFSLAMTGMRQRLECPIPSEEYLQWRLFGPIGVAKVAAAILKEAGSDGEKAFLLGELALELSQVQAKTEPGYLPKKHIQDAIAGLVAEFAKEAAPLLAGTETGLQNYVRNALKKARA